MSVKSPYYKVYIKDNREITKYVENILFEDSTEEDNIITLKIDQDYALQLADDPDFVTDNIVKFQFGYLEGAVSQLHKAKIQDITHKYKERVMMTMKCLDLGLTMKKSTSQKIWEGVTTSDVAKSIADKWGLESEIKTTTKVWDNLPQGNKSDWEFLKYLANREGSGNVVVFIRNNKLYLTDVATKDKSKITFEYSNGNGTVLSFEPTQKSSNKKAFANQSAVTTVDEKSGKVTTTVIDNTNEEDTGSTELYKFDANTGDLLGEISEDNKTVGKHNVQPVADEEEAKSLANSTKKKSAMKSMTAKLILEGQPLLVPNTIITMKNVAQRHLGNWLIVKVTHSIQNTKYTTTCELDRNASKLKSSNKASDANTSEGADKVKDEVKLPVNTYDADSGALIPVESEGNATVKTS